MKILALFKKEMQFYFTSPVAWVVFTVFTLICGYFFYSIFNFFSLISMQSAMNPMMGRDLNATEGILRPLFQNITVVLLFVMPLLTMRLLSEEKKSGTIELLLTYPIRDGEVLLGKYLAALLIYLVMLGFTVLYPVLTAYFVRLEPGPVLAGYLGLLLLGAAFIAVGVLISSMTENQIVAGFATFGVLLFFWIIGWATDFAGPALGRVISHLSILDHFENFARGILDTKDIIYYLNFTILCLFLTLRSLESRRWRG